MEVNGRGEIRPKKFSMGGRGKGMSEYQNYDMKRDMFFNFFSNGTCTIHNFTIHKLLYFISKLHI